MQFNELSQALEEYISKLFHEWVSTVEKELQRYLDLYLMKRSTTKPGKIEPHYSTTLRKLFCEMYHWERLRFEVPHYATAVYTRSEQLRVMRENVLLIVRDYNGIIDSLRPRERALFRERIRAPDKKLSPGFNKLTWASEGGQEYLISDCRIQAMKLQALINAYKSSNRKIGQSCRRISEMLFIRLDGKRVYEKEEFSVELKQHYSEVKNRVKEIYYDIISTMKGTFQVRNAPHQKLEAGTAWERGYARRALFKL